jgi:acyl-CoA thioesterase FadM
LHIILFFKLQASSFKPTMMMKISLIAFAALLFIFDTSQGFTVGHDGRNIASPMASATWTTWMASVATNGETTAATVNGEIDPKTFTSAPLKTYMEDIDAYGVMWHTNYLQAYDRAIHLTLPPAHIIADAINVLDYPDWSIVRVNTQRFKAALRLGDEYVVSGELQSRDGDVEDVWALTMYKSDDPSVVYNTATVTVARPHHDDPQAMFPNPEPFDVKTVGSFNYQIYRDEFAAHLASHIPLTSAMNIMERSRTNQLGGPDLLRKMKEEDGIVWYVVSVKDLCLVRMDEPCVPGQQVASELGVVAKRRGMILDIYHTLVLPTADGGVIRMAQGKVSIMAVNEKLGKPTANIPKWCLELLDLA